MFQDFLHTNKKSFTDVVAKDFDAFHYFMQRRGLKTNTRRRKLITARSLYRYALTRKKIRFSPAALITPPERLERLPWIPKKEQFQKFMDSITVRSPLSQRNRIVVQLLAETGMSISELCSLAWENLKGRTIQIPGKKAREVRISAELARFFALWRKQNSGKFLFPGYNRHGITSEKMTARGVEIVFRHLAQRSGFPKLKPKSLRHYATVEWLKEDVLDKEILRRLGVSASYSLQPYKKLLEK